MVCTVGMNIAKARYVQKRDVLFCRWYLFGLYHSNGGFLAFCYGAISCCRYIKLFGIIGWTGFGQYCLSYSSRVLFLPPLVSPCYHTLVVVFAPYTNFTIFGLHFSHSIALTLYSPHIRSPFL